VRILLSLVWLRRKGSDTSVYALLYKLITHLALRQSRHKPPHCKITNAITVIPPTTPYNPNSLFTNAANAHLLMNTPHTSTYKLLPYVAMMFRNIRRVGTWEKLSLRKCCRYQSSMVHQYNRIYLSPSSINSI